MVDKLPAPVELTDSELDHVAAGALANSAAAAGLVAVSAAVGINVSNNCVAVTVLGQTNC